MLGEILEVSKCLVKNAICALGDNSFSLVTKIQQG